MRTRTLRWTIATMAFFCSASIHAATRIELVIDEPRANRGVPWPVTTGVPFPRSALTRADQCRLVDDLGMEQPLQTKVAATWDEARSSIRWLTIDFLALPNRKYALEFGADVQRMPFPAAIDVAVGEVTRVFTNGLAAEFDPLGPAALKSVRIDLNGDGKIDLQEVVLAGSPDGDHVYHDQQGRLHSSRDDGRSRVIQVESNGPVRACVRVDGYYTGPAGERIVAYRTRYHFFTGLSAVKLVDEFRVIGSTRDTRFQDISLNFALPLATANRRLNFAGSPAVDSPIKTINWTDNTRAVSLVQETFRHYGNPECRGYVDEELLQGAAKKHLEAEQVGPWIQVVDGRAVATGSLRSFWQQFPKQWSVAKDQWSIALWSPRAGELDFGEAGLRKFFGPAGDKYLLDWQGTRKPQSPIENFFYFAGRHAMQRDGADGLGINKHHEVWLHFAPAAKAKESAEYGRLADQQPLCLATGAWNCSTDVFGPLAARPNDSPYEAIVDRVFELERNAQHDFGDYGWWLFGAGPHYSYQWDAETKRHYADPRRFEYHTYQRETQLWWCYLRSGERKFYDWAFPSENHWVDVAVSHAPTHYSTQWRGGKLGDAKLHYPPGDWSIDSPLHYVRHHDTGEAWLRSASQFWATYHRTLETTTLAYYLSGDERYNDVIDFWRTYWGDLAGVRSDSTGARPWHREQMWFQPTQAPQPAKSWAEMLRDYAPFQSGSRHQMTLWFNLSTLYEHTWDPKIKQSLDEYAAAFLDPKHPIGVWRCQDSDLPANADAPLLAHYWSPALWKYARATGDPRMPDILRRYFTAAVNADPFHEDVGVYSNVQIGYAWHFTHDPRHLRPALNELEALLPNAEPLAKPEDLGSRIYNPYAPIKSLAATPRLIAALADAKRRGIQPAPPAPLGLQRAVFAVKKKPAQPLSAVLWGFDAKPHIIGPDGSEAVGLTIATTQHVSHLQPFDRTLPGFAVYEHRLSIAASSPEGWYAVRPKLELGIVEMTGGDGVSCLAAEALQLEAEKPWKWHLPNSIRELNLESAQPAMLRVVGEDGAELAGKVNKNLLTVPVDSRGGSTSVTIGTRGKQPIWFRAVGLPAGATWVSSVAADAKNAPSEALAQAAIRTWVVPDVIQRFVPGRFGQAALLAPGRELHIPDEVTMGDGTTRRLTEMKQGTLEFWVQRWWDERLATPPRFNFLDNGQQSIWAAWPLKLGEWSHLAVSWRPSPRDAEQTLIHVYVDGFDPGNYRNLHWEGYGDRPPNFGKPREWLREFIARAPPGVIYAIDDVRISSSARYADLQLDFGSQHTANPIRFAPPQSPARRDDATVLLLPLDGDLRGQALGGQAIEAAWKP